VDYVFFMLINLSILWVWFSPRMTMHYHEGECTCVERDAHYRDKEKII